MLYYLIVALQIFCIYHLLKNKNQYYWIFIILFVPVLGSIIYLITQVYNKRDAEAITEGITSIINPTKKVKDLQAKLQFSDTFQNKINLADAYLDLNDIDNAINNYESALEGRFENDFYTQKQLVRAYDKLGNYKKVIMYAERIKSHGEFKKSHVQFLYGKALAKTDRFNEAQTQLEQINSSYTHYEERLAYAKLLLANGKHVNGMEILNELSSESKNIAKQNLRKYKATFAEVEKLLN
ncbi:hypothetical protein JBL43_00770 [Aureibaculum sp. A20]|uniref:Cardiolipin synthase N-terminal domain-containing protein n=1 Tax=Aureibaculum flavum TaxID=2795986 RepID=A0ABS0WLB6_9FLAO|nr:hypothetical protein [Aureibaculum flavum]MBJ2172748.1 hypothetical protein [Aureibaculum flavum]